MGKLDLEKRLSEDALKYVTGVDAGNNFSAIQPKYNVLGIAEELLNTAAQQKSNVIGTASAAQQGIAGGLPVTSLPNTFGSFTQGLPDLGGQALLGGTTSVPQTEAALASAGASRTPTAALTTPTTQGGIPANAYSTAGLNNFTGLPEITQGLGSSDLMTAGAIGGGGNIDTSGLIGMSYDQAYNMLMSRIGSGVPENLRKQLADQYAREVVAQGGGGVLDRTQGNLPPMSAIMGATTDLGAGAANRAMINTKQTYEDLGALGKLQGLEAQNYGWSDQGAKTALSGAATTDYDWTDLGAAERMQKQADAVYAYQDQGGLSGLTAAQQMDLGAKRDVASTEYDIQRKLIEGELSGLLDPEGINRFNAEVNALGTQAGREGLGQIEGYNLANTQQSANIAQNYAQNAVLGLQTQTDPLYTQAMNQVSGAMSGEQASQATILNQINAMAGGMTPQGYNADAVEAMYNQAFAASERERKAQESRNAMYYENLGLTGSTENRAAMAETYRAQQERLGQTQNELMMQELYRTPEQARANLDTLSQAYGTMGQAGGMGQAMDLLGYQAGKQETGAQQAVNLLQATTGSRGTEAEIAMGMDAAERAKMLETMQVLEAPDEAARQRELQASGQFLELTGQTGEFVSQERNRALQEQQIKLSDLERKQQAAVAISQQETAMNEILQRDAQRQTDAAAQFANYETAQNQILQQDLARKAQAAASLGDYETAMNATLQADLARKTQAALGIGDLETSKNQIAQQDLARRTEAAASLGQYEIGKEQTAAQRLGIASTQGLELGRLDLGAQEAAINAQTAQAQLNQQAQQATAQNLLATRELEDRRALEEAKIGQEGSAQNYAMASSEREYWDSVATDQYNRAKDAFNAQLAEAEFANTATQQNIQNQITGAGLANQTYQTFAAPGLQALGSVAANQLGIVDALTGRAGARSTGLEDVGKGVNVVGSAIGNFMPSGGNTT